MAQFAYKARTDEDRVITGRIEARGVSEVFDQLASKNLSPILVEELNFDGSVKGESFLSKFSRSMKASTGKVHYKQVVFFTRQLATMISGGVNLTRALDQLARNESANFRSIITRVNDDISIGMTFSDALAKHPQAFNTMFVSVVRSGEATGALDTVLDELADYMESHEVLKGKVRSAMMYPGFISVFITLIIIAIMWKLVPVFQDMYAGMGGKLPLPTQILISISAVIQKYIVLVFGALIGSVFLFKYLLTVEKFRRGFDEYILKMPVFGDILTKNILSVFCRTMALLMGAGTPMLEAIRISSAVTGNMFYGDKLETVYDQLHQGEMFSASLEKAEVFPPLIVQMVATGEESGKTDNLLRKAAQFYEREIKNTVDAISSIIEPVLIIVIGSLVGSILIALYMPIFQMGKLLK